MHLANLGQHEPEKGRDTIYFILTKTSQARLMFKLEIMVRMIEQTALSTGGTNMGSMAGRMRARSLDTLDALDRLI